MNVHLDASKFPDQVKRLIEIRKKYFKENECDCFNQLDIEILTLLQERAKIISLYKVDVERDKIEKIIYHFKQIDRLNKELHNNPRLSFVKVASKKLKLIIDSQRNDREASDFERLLTRFDFPMRYILKIFTGSESIPPIKIADILLEPEYEGSAEQSGDKLLKIQIMHECRVCWAKYHGKAPRNLNNNNTPFERFLREVLGLFEGFEETNLNALSRIYRAFKN